MALEATKPYYKCLPQIIDSFIPWGKIIPVMCPSLVRHSLCLTTSLWGPGLPRPRRSLPALPLLGCGWRGLVGQYWPSPGSREVLWDCSVPPFLKCLNDRASCSESGRAGWLLSSQEAQFLLKNQSIYRLLPFLLWTNKFVAMLAKKKNSFCKGIILQLKI